MALHLEKEIAKLKKKILALGTIVEDAVRKAVAALEKRDEKLAREVLDHDDDIDEAEIDLEEECLKILALYQPVANDLRFVIAVLKINSDLERIGDLAGSIAERAVELARAGDAKAGFNFKAMADKVQTMLRHSLDSLVNVDVSLAEEVRASDDEIDAIHRETYRFTQNSIRADIEHLEIYIHYNAISRALERIADHATNIAEDVVYMVAGDIVRHREFVDRAVVAADKKP